MGVLDRPVTMARSTIAGGFRRILTGTSEPVRPRMIQPDGDGLFGADSAAWVVHSDIATLVGGLRALLLQTLHPLAMAGVADHSSYRDDPFGRLQRTGEFLGRTIYGSRADAVSAIEQVRRIHEHVVGTAPDGRPYEANDPHLLGWVHITEVQSFLLAHRRYGSRQLGSGGADQYVAEMATVGLRLGMADAPLSEVELNHALQSYRPELEVGQQARETVRFLLFPPLPLAARAPYAVLFGAATALLPRWARWMLRLPVAPGADPLVIRPAATVLLRTLGWALGSPQRHRARDDVAVA